MNNQKSLQLSFLTIEERQLLVQLAAKNFSGAGIVVDGGSFVGSSTRALADGVLESGRPINQSQKPIVAIDRFSVLDSYIHDHFLVNGYDIRYGESFLELFLQNLGEHLNLVEVRSGDLTRVGRIESKIEIAFIDIAKTRALNSFVLLQWFPKLIPGHSLIIHQDFHSPALPWIQASMGGLLDFFDVVIAKQDESAVFKLIASIPPDDLRHAAAIKPNSEEGLACIERLIVALPERFTYMLRLSKCHVLCAMGRKGEAQQLLEAQRPLLTSPPDSKWLQWHQQTANLIQQAWPVPRAQVPDRA